MLEVGARLHQSKLQLVALLAEFLHLNAQRLALFLQLGAVAAGLFQSGCERRHVLLGGLALGLQLDDAHVELLVVGEQLLTLLAPLRGLRLDALATLGLLIGQAANTVKR